MEFSRFRTGIALRAAGLFFTFCVVICMAIVYALVCEHPFGRRGGAWCRSRFSISSPRSPAARSRAFSTPSRSTTHRKALRLSRRTPRYHELGTAMTRVIDRLHSSRAQREEQARYLQTLLAHVPVALITIDADGGIQLLNMAARRLFENRLTTAD